MEQQGRVLIVDDNAMNVDVLRRILRKEFELDTADSGEECLFKISTFKPQLVLLDVMMPGMDGCETCRRIKTSPEGDSVLVILVSGKGTAADRVNGYKALADDYVVKPFDHGELLAKVMAYFRRIHRNVKPERHEARDRADHLRDVVRQVSVDIDEHMKLIEAIQRELSVSGPENPDALIHALARLSDRNRATQERLASVRNGLQGWELECHASEDRTDSPTLRPSSA
jgi:DNA-binding response OmpR family regulator